MDFANSMFVPYSTVVLIGYGNDGPSYELVHVENSSMVDNMFGAVSQLTLAVHECYNAGARSVFVYRINGKRPYVNIQDKLIITSKIGGSKHNGTKLIIKNKYLSIGQYAYDLKTFPDTTTLVSQINYDSSVNKHSYMAELKQNVPISDLLDMAVSFDGGVDEDALPPSEIYSRLDDAYFTLAGYPFNIVVPLCAMFDNNSSVDFGEQLIKHCRGMFEVGGDTIGILPTTPTDMYTSLGNVQDSMLAELKIQKLANKGDVYDIMGNLLSTYGVDGRFLSVVVSDCEFSEGSGHTSNGAAAYAGMISYDPFTSTSNKSVSHVSNIRLLYSKEQLDNNLSKYVAFYSSIRNGVSVYKGNTMYPGFSVSVSKTLNHINTVLSNGIGDITESAPQGIQKQQITQRVEKLLKPLFDNKEIRALDVTIDDIDYNSHLISMKIDFIRYGEVRRITTEAGIYYGI